MVRRSPFQLGEHSIKPGSRQTIDLPVSVLSDHTPVSMSVHVVHGRRSGPTLFVSAAIHGDEIIGVEILRRLLRARNIDHLKGTLLAVPIVNSYGFLSHSRYLPDRRDLNRSFPGSSRGSLAARLAYLFLNEIVVPSDFGIDLHSAAIHRSNLPQVRITSRKPETLALTQAFGAPLILTSKTREGSLRHAAGQLGKDVLLFEGGEGLRFDEHTIRTGVTGILRVMSHLGMIARKGISKPKTPPIYSNSSYWVRAPAGGLLRTYKTIGDHVSTGEVLAAVADPFGEVETEITVDEAGLLIGRSNLPVVNEGDGIFHIARIKKSEDPQATIETLAEQLDSDPMFDEDEII